jgi:hypothetical protein
MAKAKTAPALPSQPVTVAHEPSPVVVTAPAPDLPTLADFIKSRERDGIVLVRVTYPGAECHVFPGKFSGVTVTAGPLSCLYADGSTE